MKMVIAGVYVLSGALAGISTIFLVFYTNSVSPSTSGNFYELYAIAAAVLDGCSLRGGEGLILGIVLGTALQVLQNLVNILGIWQMTRRPILAGGAGDNAAGAIGLSAIQPGNTFVSLGTSRVLFVTTEHFRPYTQASGMRFVMQYHRRGTRWALPCRRHPACRGGPALPDAPRWTC